MSSGWERGIQSTHADVSSVARRWSDDPPEPTFSRSWTPPIFDRFFDLVFFYLGTSFWMVLYSFCIRFKLKSPNGARMWKVYFSLHVFTFWLRLDILLKPNTKWRCLHFRIFKMPSEFLHFVSVFTARDAARFPKGPKIQVAVFSPRHWYYLSYNSLLQLKSESSGGNSKWALAFFPRSPSGPFRNPSGTWLHLVQ